MSQSHFATDAGSATHPGRVRTRNEDSFLVRTDAGLWAVADGMGGHEAGDVASQLIVKALDGIAAPTSAIELLEQCESQVSLANRQIIDISRQRGGAIIGSTVAILLISEDHYACVWAGDSRVYLVRHAAIRQLSRDHTEIEELLASGAMTAEEVKNLPNNVITRAIGVRDNPELEIVTGACEECDIFVLCSDGLTRHVTDEEILQQTLAGEPTEAAAALVELALGRGGLDNVTVVVVRPQRRRSQREPTVPTAILQEPPPATDVWE